MAEINSILLLSAFFIISFLVSLESQQSITKSGFSLSNISSILFLSKYKSYLFIQQFGLISLIIDSIISVYFLPIVV